ncbi:NADP-dependent oxidoreductase [Roseovarius sp.]|uniref:NADP-dependent oxidoreductase n=1 Tax=Roseovarius sp. TaxID=1486281 RepID=UPI003A9816C8
MHLVISELTRPEARSHEVLVKVAYAGVNPVDWKIGAGRIDYYRNSSFPLVTGRDFSGTVVEVGSQVRNFSVGDAVIGCLPGPGGSFAEYVATDALSLTRAPSNLTMAEAASIPLVGLTCWQALVGSAKLSKGEVLYVLSGAGGTGSIAVQLGAALGAKVITTCSERNRDYVTGLGANHIFDYSKPSFTDDLIAEFPQGVDVVFSNVLGPLHRDAYRTLRPGGTLVTIGEPPSPAAAKARGVDEIELIVQPNGTQLSEIVTYLEAGTIKPPTVSIHDLAHGAHAMQKIFEGHVRGKIVLQVS